MGLATTILFYLLFGAGVAAATAVRTPRGSRSELLFRVAAAGLFWPLFVPLLLESGQRAATSAGAATAREAPDPLEEAIAATESEVTQALAALEGWTGALLTPHKVRIDELQAAWRAQAARIREVDVILRKNPDARAVPGEASTSQESQRLTGRASASLRAREDNLRRLHDLRDRQLGDLHETLAVVRELATRIHLARHTGASASRADELVAQLAATVEGMATIGA